MEGWYIVLASIGHWQLCRESEGKRRFFIAHQDKALKIWGLD